MTNYSKFFKIFFVCIFLNGCTECTKNWVHPDIKNYFLQSVNLSPIKKTYNKFDTVRIEILVPNKLLFDTLSKTAVQTDSISLPLNIGINNLNNGQPPAPDGYFDFVDSNGQKLVVDTLYSYLNHGVNFSTTSNCSQNVEYSIIIGIVLKDTGVYIMRLSGGSVLPCLYTNNPQNFYSYIDYYFNLSEFNTDVYNSVPQNLRREGSYDFGTKKLFVFRVTK